MEYGISHVKEGPGPHRHKALQVRSTLSKLRGPIPRPAPPGQHPYAAHLATILSPLCILGDLCGDRPIMQNKPNFQEAKMTLNPCCEKHYGKIHPLLPPTKQSQTKPICRGEAYSEAGTNLTCRGEAFFGACNWGPVRLGSGCVELMIESGFLSGRAANIQLTCTTGG